MKRITSLAIMSATTLALLAAPLTPEQALKRVQGNSALKMPSKSGISMKLSFSMQTQKGEPAVYIFDRPASSGYLIVSADDTATPLLGYADSGSFDANNMPPQLEWWLSEYASQIDYASANGIKNTYAPIANKKEIAPLVKTKWNQGTPYNNLCPSVNNVKCPSGCVATAMAQVMKFWNYPEVGTGRVTATLPSGGTGEGFINLAQKPFDWNNMIDSYSGYDYTNEQGNAVATLMQAAGYAAKMNYAPGGSGALSINAAISLSKNFKYNPNIQYLQRLYFNTSEWNEIVYNELAAGRPILYGGQSTSVGHEFVCDGYDGNGYFHFNWGWGGMSDGYFILDALNPNSVGTGGGAGGGYNSRQDIIIGIQPSSVETDVYLTQFGNLSASASGSNISLALNYNGNVGNWVNAGISAVKVRMGAEIVSVDNPEIKPQYVRLFSNDIDIPALTLNGYNISYQGIKGNATVSIPSILPNGKYKVTVCTQDANKTDAPWTPVCTTNGAYNFVYVTKNGSSCSVENFNETELSIVSAEPTTQVYYENACRFRLSVKNNSNLELSGGFYPVLYDGNTPAFLGEGITMSLAPGESDNVEFVTTFELLKGVSAPTETKEYTLRFSKNASGSAFYNWSKPLSMGLLLRAPSFNTSNYCIEGAPTREETINGQTRTAFVVPDPSEIPFAATITNTGTFFGSPVYTLIFNSTLSGYNLTSLAMGPTAILNRGESATVTGSADFTEAEDGEAYAAALFYINGGKLTQHNGSQILYFIVDSTASAVNDIESDNTTSDNEIYNLQGIPVGKDINSLPAGIYIRNGKKILKRH
ncbi:MAG: C10 family peptidase [Muribaculaceae bacterium]|nr:C10 family peptidase [Muribaculaceae bacterium]